MREFLTRPRSEDDVCIEIPGYRQTKSYTCGYVSGMMVLHTFDPEACGEEFYTLCRAHDEWGMSTRKLATALRKKGIRVSIRKKFTLDEIADCIEAGMPIITSIKRVNEIQHWIVIYGVNRKTRELFVAGEKFWFSPAGTVFKWNEFRHRFPAGVDFLVCSSKSRI